MFRLNERAFYVLLVKEDIFIITTQLNDWFKMLVLYGALFLARPFERA